MVISGAIAVVVVIFLIWYAIVGNGLIRLRNYKEEAWSGIDVQLKRRHDLIGNLVNAVKGSMLHEKDMISELSSLYTQARMARGIQQTAFLESQLSSSLNKLLAAIGKDPELRGNSNVLQLQDNLSELEDDLQKARRYYNGCVREYNNKIEMFPSSIVAQTKHYEKADFFELTEGGAIEAPQVNFWKTKKCPFCGADVQEHFTTCPSCGAKQMDKA